MKKFRLLLSLAWMLKLVGWVELALGIISAAAILFVPNYLAKVGVAMVPGSAWLMFLLVLLFSVSLAILLLGSGEMIQLWLTLENHLRKLREIWDKE